MRLARFLAFCFLPLLAAAPAEQPIAITTFECVGLYWKSPGGKADTAGARVHAILLEAGVHDVVIENCDISGWGRIAEDGWGRDYDAAIYSKDPSVKRIIVQRNRIHHPRSNSNNWQQARPGPGKTEPSHPEGPQAVCLWDSEGNDVIRYNTVFSDDNHQYNDIFGAGHNFSTRGFGRGMFALAPKSPGFDAGAIIPNFNDGFVGPGPDIGAPEAGSPPMEFGVEAYRK